MWTSFPNLATFDHTFQVPLNYANPADRNISIFVRELRKPSDKPEAGAEADEKKSDKKYLVYLQGGPGHRAGRPTEGSGGWIGAALDAGFRVLLLDQRGTGLSTRASTGMLTRMAKRDGATATADYLSNFRADNIVRDCEEIRKSLGIEKWTLLGQSFGGFCSVQYLSQAPDALQEALLTGGLPPLVAESNAADGTYRALFPHVRAQNAKFYKRFPGDVAAVKRIVERLLESPAKLPMGGTLTARGFQCLGIMFGLLSGFETVHYIIEDAFDADGELSHEFLAGVERIVGCSEAPLYLLLHESIYCNNGTSNWACERVRNEPENFALFDAQTAIDEGRPILFTGEMMFPWMLDELSEMAPLKEVGHELAKREWPALYDVDCLKTCKVPVAAATYVEDMFVQFDLARETARIIGSEHRDATLGGEHVRQLMTSAYNHSGLREDGAVLFKELLAMARDEHPVR